MQDILAAALGLVAGVTAAAVLTSVVEQFVHGGSALPRRCVGCGAGLGLAAYVPLLRDTRHGACRSCGRPQGSGLWFELLTMLGTVLLVWLLRVSPELPLDLLVFWLGVAAAAIDLRMRIIPNRLLLAAGVLGLLALAPLGAAAYVAGIIGAVLLLAIGLLIAWIGRGGFGLGDVKYVATIGLLLGWQRGLSALFLAVLLGGIYAAWLLLTRRATGADAFAFGPFIALGSVAVVLLGAGMPR